MHKGSQISLCKLFLRQPFQRSPKPTSSFSLTTASNRSVSDLVSPPKPSFLDVPTSKIHCFLHPTISSPSTQFMIRSYSGESVTELDKNKVVDEINLKFAEAREEIDVALDSKETVYFDEEAECARAAVKEVVDMFEGLLAKLTESERAALQRSMGLKMEQLKAEIEQLND